LKKKQDAGVPNLYPYKLALIEQTTTEKLQEREQKARAAQLKKAHKETAAARKQQEEASLKKDYELMNTVEGRRKWYFKELMKVVEASDVIIQVLDARDPMGCRAVDIERRILAQQTKEGRPAKKLILLLNKVDMVPAENVASWVGYLKREHPTLAFKSSTQKGRGHLQQIDINLSKNKTSATQSQSSVGASQLLQLLKNYARNSANSKTGLTVGVIGYPNVGKSSVINSLKSQRVAQVSPSAGCTKALQYIKLDSTITLVDSPGVLFGADFDNTDLSEDTVKQKHGLLLRNALRADQVEDPQEVVKAILSRITPEQLTQIYNIANFKTPEEFLLFIAHRNGKLGRGGVPNLDDAAKTVINDWNFGKIPFYSVPPVIADVQESKIVTGFSEAFDIDALLGKANDEVVKVFKNGQLVPPQGDMMGDDDDDDDGMYDDEDFDEDGMYDDEDFDDDEDDDMGDSDDGLNAMGGAKPKPNTASVVSKAAKKPQVAQGGYYQEDSSDADDADDADDGFEVNNDTAFKLQQQQAYHKQQNKQTKPTAAQGKAKASTVLNKSYQIAGVTRAPTRSEMKKAIKVRQRASERDKARNQDNDDYDWESLE
jgi:nuclear GTP-binding protein